MMHTEPLNEENTYRVEFDATLQDCADVQLRRLKRSTVARSWWRRDSIVTSSVTGVGTFVLLGFVNPSMPVEFRLIFSAAWTVVFTFLWHRISRSQRRHRIQQYVREQLGDGPFRVVIELRQEGAWVRQANVELLFDWKDATAVDDTPDALELIFRTGSVVARDRAFTSAAQRAAFLQRARELMRANAGSAPA